MMFQPGEWDKDTKINDAICQEIIKNSKPKKKKTLNNAIKDHKKKIKEKGTKSKQQLQKNVQKILQHEKNINNQSTFENSPSVKKKLKKKNKKKLLKQKISIEQPPQEKQDGEGKKNKKFIKNNPNNQSPITKSPKNNKKIEIINNINTESIAKKKKKNKKNLKSKIQNIKNEDSNNQNNRKEAKDMEAEKNEPLTYQQKKKEKLKNKLKNFLDNPTTQVTPSEKKKNKDLSLRERMMRKLKGARFRYLNEEIYSTDSKEAQRIFQDDPDAFEAYHEGYRQQVEIWPLNPVDNIIKSIQKMPKSHKIADFGCGEAKLAQSVEQEVHSFDLVAINDFVTACDMSKVPLKNESIDVVVFCLSLMGTNLHEYILEANRVLKVGGILKIAEVESRFDNIDEFIKTLQQYKFKNTWKDLSHNLFYFLDFKKETNIKNKNKLPSITLQPCLYKKR